MKTWPSRRGWIDYDLSRSPLVEMTATGMRSFDDFVERGWPRERPAGLAVPWMRRSGSATTDGSVHRLGARIEEEIQVRIQLPGGKG